MRAAVTAAFRSKGATAPKRAASPYMPKGQRPSLPCSTTSGYRPRLFALGPSLWAAQGSVAIMMLRMLCFAAAGVVALGHARAAEKTMSIHFVGDWCYESEEGTTTTYTLPSWTEGGLCTKILSINEYGFYGQGSNCEPETISLTENTAQSGTAYIAEITARCQPDGPVTEGKLQTFKFERYKGHLTVTTK
jgi:hypothetical protein